MATDEIILCNCCGIEMEGEKDYFPYIEIVTDLEFFVRLKDLHMTCYTRLVKSINKTIKKIRGEKNDKT